LSVEDRAKALAGLPAPKEYGFVELSEMRRASGCALSQELSRDDSDDDLGDDPGNEKNPSGKGVSSSANAACQELAFGVSSGGGGNWHCKIIVLVLTVLQKGLRTFNLASTNGIFRQN
jgi:hypothetical protein